ncbi:MAG: nuclear transport factor 2 family protein [Gammaproteobacteria bacterium]|nr:nuclear transport factor 2 family protein [Gammaproteobacteria bacterium]
MQYQSRLDRDGLVDLALRRYFASVDRKDLEATLACFHDSANFTVQTAFTVHAGKDAIRRMFVDFFRNYDVIVHRDFTCTVDDKNGRIAASFIADLEDPQGHGIRLHNTNFWRVRDDRFQEVYVYMSGANPLL